MERQGQARARSCRRRRRASRGRRGGVPGILHRYVAIDRRDAIQPAFDLLRQIADDILAIDATTVDQARSLVLAYRTLSARDAIHAAVIQRHAISRVLSFDRGFDVISGLSRLTE